LYLFATQTPQKLVSFATLAHTQDEAVTRLPQGQWTSLGAVNVKNLMDEIDFNTQKEMPKLVVAEMTEQNFIHSLRL
jgi:hypothetical protein